MAHPTHPQIAPKTRVISVDQRATAIALRREGKTYQRIGEIMQITKQTAHHLVISGIAELRERMAEDVETIKAIELERMDHLYRVLAKRLVDVRNLNIERTVDSMLRVMERRAKLLGLDAPIRIDTGPPALPAPDWDVTKLSTDQLRELDAILEAMGGKPEGEPVKVIEAPATIVEP